MTVMILEKYFNLLKERIKDYDLKNLEELCALKIEDINNKRIVYLRDLYNSLPEISAETLAITAEGRLKIGNSLNDKSLENSLYKSLNGLIPWRKGPFTLFNIEVDGEWDSNMKFSRIKPYLDKLEKKSVLDIGSGNGYYSLRMTEFNPSFILAIEPFMWNYFQFLLIDKYLNQKKVSALPLRIEELPADLLTFDVIFSMGVLYHRKSPYEHLEQVYALLKDKGVLFLETLIAEGDGNNVIFPEARYACMKNVWFIPTVNILEVMLRRVGFKNIKCIDVTWTSEKEQRVTNWMPGRSLMDFLDNNNKRLTIEGYQAPLRAIIRAEK